MVPTHEASYTSFIGKAYLYGASMAPKLIAMISWNDLCVYVPRSTGPHSKLHFVSHNIYLPCGTRSLSAAATYTFAWLSRNDQPGQRVWLSQGIFILAETANLPDDAAFQAHIVRLSPMVYFPASTLPSKV
jgi:hypothetical protein